MTVHRRCDECGSWGEECVSETAQPDCACARCANARVRVLEAERDEARAEVERLNEVVVKQHLAYATLMDAYMAACDVAQHNYVERADKAEAEVERLREALLARCPRHCEADHEAGVCELTRREVAALADAHEDAPMLMRERRALAERVREACAEADDFNADAADGLRCAIRALDLDALLEER